LKVEHSDLIVADVAALAFGERSKICSYSEH